VMAKLDHPCIVKLLGVSEGKLLLMVSGWPGLSL
jgi:hypothetical protein